jgi:hypothetical protein
MAKYPESGWLDDVTEQFAARIRPSINRFAAHVSRLTYIAPTGSGRG